jgi:serine/threonine-protein kinase
LKKSLELNPSYAAYANLGSLLSNQKRFSEAAVNFEKALTLNSENYLVWSWLANAYQWTNQREKATTALDKAFQLASRETSLKPRDPLARITLASLSAKKHLADKALGDVQTALILAPDDADVLENAALTYELLGDRAKALEFAGKALQKGYSLDHMKSDADMQGVLNDPKFHPNQK